MFNIKKLTLAAPHKWDDPFENFLAKCKADFDGIPNVGIELLFRNFYGQCWTLNPESDAMWRIYSPNKDGARVKTTVGRLFRSIYNPNNTFATMSYFIGSVCYKTEDEIRKIFEDPNNASGLTFDQTGRGQALPFFIKREAFSHEQEVRLLFRFNEEGNKEQRSEEFWPFDINPNDLFDEVTFDPRMSDGDVRNLTNSLRSSGFAKPINQSILYQVPNLKIKLTSAAFR